jgi:hypothetical protein
MSNRRFPILGTSLPPMLGRERITSRMISALSKSIPDHLQVVGPRFAGKTIILHELARKFRDTDAPYTAVVMWDLGHQSPGTDEVFMQRLARELSSALTKNHGDYAEHLKTSQTNPYQDIGEVLDALKAEGGKVLMLMDGFDKPLSNGKLTRNLWDQLRELASKPSLRLVTASRRTLRDLIRNPEAQTSDFWNIFEPPIPVGCFDDSDLRALCMGMPDVELTSGAQTELWSATNGFPVMMLDVLNAMIEMGSTGPATSQTMVAACDHAYPAVRDKIDALWMDCPPSCQDLFRRVQEQGELPRTDAVFTDAALLIERGFVHQEGNKLQRPSRMLCRFLNEQPNEGSALVRLFGSAEGYLKHFKGVLQCRVGQIAGMDKELRRYLERSIDDLPNHPRALLTNIRGIVNKAFELIWKAELGSRTIPPDWMSTWKSNREPRIEDWPTTFPEGGRRVQFLNLMTGTERSKRRARYVTKETYLLMNAAYTFGDYGVHQEDGQQTIDLGTAYLALHLCIELAATLTRELPAS